MSVMFDLSPSLVVSMLNKGRDQGYALTEVLVAAAISAAVITATMTGMSASLRGGRNADDMQQAVLEARNISARLRAGISAARVAEAYPNWQIELRPVERPVDSRTGAVLTRAIIGYGGDAQFGAEFIFLEDGNNFANTP
jgi:type II secretory pathway pseudopilin PulG